MNLSEIEERVNKASQTARTRKEERDIDVKTLQSGMEALMLACTNQDLTMAFTSIDYTVDTETNSVNYILRGSVRERGSVMVHSTQQVREMLIEGAQSRPIALEEITYDPELRTFLVNMRVTGAVPRRFRTIVPKKRSAKPAPGRKKAPIPAIAKQRILRQRADSPTSVEESSEQESEGGESAPESSSSAGFRALQWSNPLRWVFPFFAAATGSDAKASVPQMDDEERKTFAAFKDRPELFLKLGAQQ